MPREKKSGENFFPSRENIARIWRIWKISDEMQWEINHDPGLETCYGCLNYWNNIIQCLFRAIKKWKHPEICNANGKIIKQI